MTDITTYPMIDDFDTTLAQARDGAVGTVYLNDAVGITIPANTTTYIVVNPGKSIMQLAEINAVDNTLKTATVSNVTLNKGAGVAYTQQSHPVGSVVRISSNYAFWKDIVDAVNTKVNTNDDDIAQGKFADATARDAYFTSPVNGNSAYLTAEGKWTDYIAGAWADRDVGTVTANASTTVAGKAEQATAAQNTAGTATGETGAPLFSTPADMAAQIQSGSWVYCASSTGSDTYTANLTPSLTAYTTGMLLPCKFTTTNTGACSININSLGAKSIKTLDGNDPQTGVIRVNGVALLQYDGTNFIILEEDFATTSNKGTIEIATDAEVATGTDTARATTPAQLRANSKTSAGTTSRATSDSTGTQNIAHGLGIAPRLVEFKYVEPTNVTGNAMCIGTYDGSTNRSIGVYDAGATTDYRVGASYCIEFVSGSGSGRTATATVDATNIVLSWTKVASGRDIVVMRTAHA